VTPGASVTPTATPTPGITVTPTPSPAQACSSPLIVVRWVLKNPFNDTDPASLPAAIANYTLNNNTGSSTFGSGTVNVPPGANGQIPAGTEIVLGTTSNCCDIGNVGGILSYDIGWTSSNGAIRPSQQRPDYNYENYCDWAAGLPIEGSPALPTFTLSLS
jgi:hypothetical protein